MNIRLLRIYPVPLRISSPELRVSDTCLLQDRHLLERYVTTTFRLHELHVYVQNGYVTTTVMIGFSHHVYLRTIELS